MFQRTTRTACTNSFRRSGCASSSTRHASSKRSLFLSLVVFTSILALSCVLFPHFSYAAQSKAITNTYTKTSQSNDAKPYWTWDDTTKTLNFYYGEMPAAGTEISLERYRLDSLGIIGRTWNNHTSDCEHVVIDPSFVDLPSVPYLDLWFYGMSTLEDVMGLQHLQGITSLTSTFENCGAIKKIDLSNVDASLVSKLNQSFAYCSELTDLDLSSFTSAPVTTIDGMCRGDARLKTVNLFGFNTQNLQNVNNAFSGCSDLVHLDFTVKSCVLTGNYAFLGFQTSCQNIEDTNIVGLTISGNQATSDESALPFYGNNSYKRVTLSNGIFDWSSGYSDNTPGTHPSGDFYAYRNGEEVPGDTYGQITKARIDAASPTTFISDKTATFKDYFYANGGTFDDGTTMATTTGTIDQSASAPTHPTREGYRFKGWKTADGIAVSTNGNASYDFGKYGVSTYNTFYADWVEDNPVTLTFDANGGTFASTGSMTITLDNQVPGETLASVEEPEKEGHTFAGWVDASGTTVVFPLIIPEVNAAYTATWTAEPGPGPEPTPSPEPIPATDGSEILPVTGDTNNPAIFALGIAGTGIVLALLGGAFTLAQKRHA